MTFLTRSGSERPAPHRSPVRQRSEDSGGAPADGQPRATPFGVPAPSEDALQLRPLEVASGLVAGVQRGIGVLPRGPGKHSGPLAALEAAVLPALLRPPCVVSFSGGRDSSAVLAIAAEVARREGLAPPVPMSLRFPHLPHSDESAWQELVVRHLRLEDWVRKDVGDELDLVGPYAAPLLRGLGLLFPHNAHFHAPFAEEAGGGSVVTGVGGDEVLASSQWLRTRHILTLRLRPRRRDIPRLGMAALPPAARAGIWRRRASPLHQLSWLRPSTQEQLNRVLAWQRARVPVSCAREVRRAIWPSRALRMGTWSLARVAEAYGAKLHTPLLDAPFLDAYARRWGVVEPPGRGAAMEDLVGALLPKALVHRPDKSRLDGAFFASHSAAFAAVWTGKGLDEDLVCPDAIRAEWSRQPRPDARASLLLQHVWLASQEQGSAAAMRP